VVESGRVDLPAGVRVQVAARRNVDTTTSRVRCGVRLGG
jgi:hypothetical protein